MRKRKDWEDRGKPVAYKNRPAIITRICRDGTFCLTYIDGLYPRVVYRVPRKAVL